MAFADSATPTWNKQLRMSDGRTFVTDGAFALDAAIAKPAELPKVVLHEASAKILEGYMTAPATDEFGVGDMSSGARAGSYRSPSGVVLNALYVDFLRRVLPSARFRTKGELQPVAILSSGKPVGVVMPMKP